MKGKLSGSKASGRGKHAVAGGGLKYPAHQPSAVELKEFCGSYGLTQETFTRLTGFSLRAIANWAKGETPSDSSKRRLAETNRIFSALERLLNKQTIAAWLKEPNPAFDGSTPLQVIERGETDRIWRMIYELESGAPG